MKYLSLALLILGFNLIGHAVKAQEEIKLDEYLEPTSKRKHSYLRTLKKESDLWAFTDRTKDGVIFQEGYFKDETMQTRVGHFIFYLNGQKLYEGDYTDGAPRGVWYFYKAGKLQDSLFYTRPLVNIESVKKTAEGLYLVNAKTSLDPDSATFAKVEVESEFPGGQEAWRKHLVKSLKFPEIVLQTMKPFTKRCDVQFIVCADGTVCDVQAINSVHPLLDLQAVNAIRKGPSWSPAVQNERKVKSYKRQPITFAITEN
jgi:hypothetical protein